MSVDSVFEREGFLGTGGLAVVDAVIAESDPRNRLVITKKNRTS